MLRNKRETMRIALPRLLLSVAVANAASYAVLLAIAFTSSHGRSDFEFVENADWLNAPADRLWYVSDSRRLCSICLNGTDKRVVSDAKLGTFTPVWDNVSVYALIGSNKLLLVDDQNRWVECIGSVKRLTGHSLDTVAAGRFSDEHLWPLIQQLMVNEGQSTSTSTSTTRANDIYFSRLPNDHHVVHAESSSVLIRGYVDAPNGLGNGLTVRRKHTGEEWKFSIPIAIGSLACREPIILDDRLIVFRCGGTICVMDLDTRRVGCLARGDSIVMKTEPFGPPGVE